ncbi:hypothetical protein GCT13_45130 [Paraburkholderia sp. CNPSo 3157]|uniref:Uncharacterized protein n=1 Tax=Paraburkholderia franconis TaxID=2654983 RepID=A0A7X1TLE5_9BURK|nr:hypothetical protein [Paraburkholderia franconis]MPW23697.1 hypothetical protein [Paraburkholderia franconis]
MGWLWLWTWGGTSFGYREGDDLWTHDGRHVGRFTGQEVYAPNGVYLGELIGTDRLITCQVKRGRRQAGFTPFAPRTACTAPGALGYAMYAGHEDFPAPESLR